MAIQIWKLKKTIQKTEKALELDTSATLLPARSGRRDTGRAEIGKLNPYDPPESDTKKHAE